MTNVNNANTTKLPSGNGQTGKLETETKQVKPKKPAGEGVVAKTSLLSHLSMCIRELKHITDKVNDKSSDDDKKLKALVEPILVKLSEQRATMKPAGASPEKVFEQTVNAIMKLNPVFTKERAAEEAKKLLSIQ